MQIYYDFFRSEEVEESTREELKEQAVEQLAKVSKVLTEEDRNDKILSLLLEMLKDDSDEEKRILGLEILDCLAGDFGQEVCENYLIYEIVSL